MDSIGPQSGEDFQKMLAGYRLTTASILYRLPDHPALLQEFLWQELDQIPGFPVLRRFIRHWHKECEGKLYRVSVAVADHFEPARWRHAQGEWEFKDQLCLVSYSVKILTLAMALPCSPSS